ncbi:MAG TPA: hypothetical protein VGB52_07605 [Actinomycetota bacterium]
MDQDQASMLEHLDMGEQRANRRLRTAVASVWTLMGVWMIVGGVILDVTHLEPPYWIILWAGGLLAFLAIAFVVMRRSGMRPSRGAVALFPFWLPALALAVGQLTGFALREVTPAIDQTLGGVAVAAGFFAVSFHVTRPLRK